METTPASWQTRRPLVPELALVSATCAYGSTFVIVQDALEQLTPTGMILMRFAIGAAVLAPFAWRRGWSLGPAGPRSRGRFLGAAAIFGAVGFVGYWFQNAGLQYTTTSNSAFITGLFVLFTPLIESVLARRPPSRSLLRAIAVAVLGLYLLTGAEPRLGKGDALTVGCAFMFAIWISLGGRFSQRYEPMALTAVQMAAFAVLAAPAVAVQGIGHLDAGAWAAVVITGVLCSAFAFSIQLWGQRFVEPSRAAVILLFEPVVAGVIGYVVGERLGVTGYAGAVLILASIVLAEAPAWRRRSG